MKECLVPKRTRRDGAITAEGSSDVVETASPRVILGENGPAAAPGGQFQSSDQCGVSRAVLE